mmetsp:Transcript_8490/g.25010  ORF Transcript_8490/g.25010 Transcript_8490/m.25010 type:complete len:207 (-) Transcript_8490:62-682(-)
MSGSSSPSPWRSTLKSLLAKVTNGLGFQLPGRPRKVRFQPEADVFEFDRQLLGGGGVPEHDAMSLGLGNKLVSSYSLPLAEKQGKDEYAATGYLDLHERTRLLSQWEKRKALQTKLTSEVGPELETLQRLRHETATNPRDQRYMPSNQLEANAVAYKDEEAAKKVVAVPLKSRAMPRTALGSCSNSNGVASPPPRSIYKKRRRHSL